MNGELLNLKFWGYETRPAIYPNLLTMMTFLNLIKDRFMSHKLCASGKTVPP